MQYERWRDELFGQPPDSDPVSLERSEDFYAVAPAQAFDFVDRVLLDPNVHRMFSKDQLGIGLNTIYSNCCSDLPFLYTTECDEDRRVTGITNLVNLYGNFFERYCTGSVEGGAYGQPDGKIGFVCYMFWDIFVLYPGNATPKMRSSAIGVMRSALDSRNDNCLASAIHGLGHWVSDVPEAKVALKHWLVRPTTKNSQILDYARSATTGMIL